MYGNETGSHSTKNGDPPELCLGEESLYRFLQIVSSTFRQTTSSHYPKGAWAAEDPAWEAKDVQTTLLPLSHLTGHPVPALGDNRFHGLTRTTHIQNISHSPISQVIALGPPYDEPFDAFIGSFSLYEKKFSKEKCVS